jgi:UDP-N-acetylglucosamine 2-epimerase (non-hydrolysing)
VLTDSGGIQEETTALGVPCITLRHSTERPVTVRLGTNRLAGDDLSGLLPALRASLSETRAVPTIPLWDGHAAERIVQVLEATIADPRQPRLAR